MDLAITAGGFSMNQIVGKIGCVYMITANQYYDINFNSWTASGTGGGFGYTRTRTSPYQWN